jgi:hypothetical protein
MTSCPLSQGHLCPQLFAKRHQTSIRKDACKDLLADERKKGRKTERERENESKKHTSFYYKINY